MEPEYVYYCTKPGELEDLICVLTKPITLEQKEKLLPTLEDAGFDLKSFREHVFNWQKPDFAKTVNI